LAEKAKLEVGPPNSKPKLNPYYQIAVEDYRFNDALSLVWKDIGAVDLAISQAKPWELVDSNPEGAKQKLTDFIDSIRLIAFHLSPFLPETAEKINQVFAGPKVKAATPLFPRLEPNA
jgi:methionyl-tRNA synthetase